MSTLDIGKTSLSVCDNLEEVKGRLESCSDLRAEDAVYHS